ncbi:uncharacterized protein LOC107365483 [Tetranychus urticae]|uniref:uncharacterized protein LOC107365483 n=1 Tax=Tetranychus urticae TaxID=32264 RepID=UPI00077BBCB2|nr:uncharacterized protein LOC107365483 [Tetranychus urticae]
MLIMIRFCLITIFIFGFSLCDDSLKAKKLKMNCHLKRIEDCFGVFDKYSNGSVSSSDLLSTSRGLDDVCINSKDVMRCLRDHVQKCGTPLQRELADYIVDEFTHSIDRFCKPGQMREDFLKHSPCIVEKVLSTKEYKESCNNPFLASVDGTNQIETMDDRLQSACCSYNRWHDCLYAKITTHCQEDGKKSMVDFIDKTFGKLPDMICPASEFNFKGPSCKPFLKENGSNQLDSSTNPITRYMIAHLSFLFHH